MCLLSQERDLRLLVHYFRFQSLECGVVKCDQIRAHISSFSENDFYMYHVSVQGEKVLKERSLVLFCHGHRE